MMNSWNMRPQEVANLLNPAFSCVAIATFVFSYSKVKNEGMPLVLAFIALTVLLNEKSRNALPNTPRKSLANWLEKNFDKRLLLQEMIVPYRPYVQESILFGLMHEWLCLTSSGDLKTPFNEIHIKKIINKNFTGDTKKFLLHSKFLGKWFALSGTTETVMALWGVKP